MSSPSDADRLERERAFHDERYTEETREAANKYYNPLIDTGQHAYQLALQNRVLPSTKLLEYGCGTGSQSFDLARQGAHVTGIDISDVGVRKATEIAAEQNMSERTDFQVMNAEDLTFDDGTFDVVCGSGILHHLDISTAISEVYRVLKLDGQALFYEPLGMNPLINGYRDRTPGMRTPDEHPLVNSDIKLLQRTFSHVEFEYHNLLSIGNAAVLKVPVVGKTVARLVQKVDRWLLENVSFLQRYAWVIVIKATK